MNAAASARENLANGGKLSLIEWVGFFSMVMGMFMAILDIQIVASSLSQVQAGLSASADEITWVQTSYLIAEVIMIPLSGWLSRAFSTRILFCVSCAGFTISSLMCAMAWNLDSMIVFRAIQGFLGGAMIPTVFATIFIMFPPKVRMRMNIILGLTVTLAPTMGPVLGGYLTDAFSWHAMFLVNVIPGIIVTLMVWFFMDIDKPDWSLLKRIDFMGIFYIAMFLGSMQYALEEGVRKDWFSSNEIIVATILAAVGAVMTFWRELTIAEPIVNLRAFTNRNFAVGSTFAFVVGIGLYTAVSLQPQFLAQVRGFDSFQIGTYLMVTGGFQLLATPFVGSLLPRVDPRLLLAFGLVMFGCAVWENGQLTAESGFWDLFWPQAMRGMGLMFCMVPVNNIALGTLPVDQIKNASGIYNLMRNLGGAIGLAIVSTLQLSWDHFYQGLLRENVTAGSVATQAYLSTIQARMEQFPLPNPDLAATQMLYNTMLREANVLTFNALFTAGAIMFFCAIPLVLLFSKGKPPPADAGGH